MASNAGDMIAREVVMILWKRYREREEGGKVNPLTNHSPRRMTMMPMMATTMTPKPAENSTPRAPYPQDSDATAAYMRAQFENTYPMTAPMADQTKFV